MTQETLGYGADFVLAALHGASTAGGHSWSTVNAATGVALSVAIRYHFHFELGDMSVIFSKCRIPGDADAYYREACESGNKSAARSMEQCFGWKPFFVRLSSARPSHHGSFGRKPLNRGFVGLNFQWEGENVKGTSFTEGRREMIACAYHFVDGRETSKIKRRFVISRAAMNTAASAEKALRSQA